MTRTGPESTILYTWGLIVLESYISDLARWFKVRVCSSSPAFLPQGERLRPPHLTPLLCTSPAAPQDPGGTCMINPADEFCSRFWLVILPSLTRHASPMVDDGGVLKLTFAQMRMSLCIRYPTWPLDPPRTSSLLLFSWSLTIQRGSLCLPIPCLHETIRGGFRGFETRTDYRIFSWKSTGFAVRTTVLQLE